VEFYVRPGIFGMISRFVLVLTLLYCIQVNSCYKGMNDERQS